MDIIWDLYEKFGLVGQLSSLKINVITKQIVAVFLKSKSQADMLHLFEC